MGKLNILITSGGTSEYIDDVRILTNISSGKLGATIADNLVVDGNVIYLHGRNAWMPKCENITSVEIKDTTDLMNKMEQLVPKVDVVVHAMAVSDFSFKRENAVKLKSSDPQAFIDFMRDNIVVNPKVISHIKQWNPKVFLIGFKFEVGKTTEELINIAFDSLLRNNCDLVIANDKKEMIKDNSHTAYFVSQDKTYTKVGSKEEIALKIKSFL